MACGAICDPFPFLAPKPWSRYPYGRRQPGSIDLLKNSTMFPLTWQEIVDFS
jgi:hypothetical protein